MASFRRHKGKWTATARVPDAFSGPTAGRSISDTFRTKREARIWADSVESAMRLGTWRDPRLEAQKSSGRWEDRPLKETLARYRAQVTPTKRGAKQEATLLERLERHELADRPIGTIGSSDVAAYRDERLAAGKAASTIRNELNTISNVFQVARYDWGYKVGNPVYDLRQRRGAIPPAGPGRDRRLRGDEQERLERALSQGLDGDLMLALWRILLDTGMRLSEALGLDVGAVRRGERSIVLEKTKNGDDREVLLSELAWQQLLEHVRGLDEREPLFGDLQVPAVEYRYRLARREAGVLDFRIHDLRHEALSRMAARNVDLKTMMLQSGHRSPAMLLRYLNPTVEERRRKLFGEPQAA